MEGKMKEFWKRIEMIRTKPDPKINYLRMAKGPGEKKPESFFRKLMGKMKIFEKKEDEK